MSQLPFNKVCALKDFGDSELAQVMRDVFRHEVAHFSSDFPRGAEYRKYWEIAMSVRALRHFGALHSGAALLGVGAGTEATIYYLANHARQVFATDLYLEPGIWGAYAPGFMLSEPWQVAPYEYDKRRLVVQHMDGRCLNYPDSTFDGIFSSSSIEHFGELDEVANAAYEMGRVLKKNGILTLSTEYKISNPPDGASWDLNHVRLFSLQQLKRYIIEASGLELVDEIDTTVDADTMATAYDLNDFMKDMYNQTEEQGPYPRVGEIIWSRYPHLVLTHRGYVFTSIHLTLRKTSDYPKVMNEWAKPQWERIYASSLQPKARRRPAIQTLTRTARRIPPLKMLAHSVLHARDSILAARRSNRP